MNKILPSLSVSLSLLAWLTTTLLSVACSPADTRSASPFQYTLVTIADARQQPAQRISHSKTKDSVGDLLVFHQPLLDTSMQSIGQNSGFCIRTRIASSFQCQWTLQIKDGSIQVAGQEFDQGSSRLSIIGGTGKYAGIYGEMISTNNNDGTFTQSLSYNLPAIER